jgi:hypothetical protein
MENHVGYGRFATSKASCQEWTSGFRSHDCSYLLWPIRSSLGFPSLPLLFGTRPV